VDQNPWIPFIPDEYGQPTDQKAHPRQRQFLLLSDIREILYGGAARGGKTYAALMAAAQYVEIPGYKALILRENFADLMQPGGFIPVSKEWWMGKANWSEQNKMWTFPSGAIIRFGYLERDDSVFQYQGGEYHFICIDELTQHTEWRYTYLFSRQSKPQVGLVAQVPLRMRAMTNPGGKGHGWVKKRFIDPATAVRGTVFVSAKVTDNLSVNQASYVHSLSYLDPLTRAQLLEGDWDAVAGGLFLAEWFSRRFKRRGDYIQVIDGTGKLEYEFLPWAAGFRHFITVDPAASTSEHADFTVVSLWIQTNVNDLIWLGCERFKAEIPDIVPRIQTAYKKHKELTGRERGKLPELVGIEAIASNRGVFQLATRATNPSFPAHALEKGATDKKVHATKAINLASNLKVILPAPGVDRSFPLDDVLSELVRFTGDDKKDDHDDIVDTLSYAAEILFDLPSHGSGRNSLPTVIGG
jgi:hypothetical protein